jgi:hypothetical protein
MRVGLTLEVLSYKLNARLQPREMFQFEGPCVKREKKSKVACEERFSAFFLFTQEIWVCA